MSYFIKTNVTPLAFLGQIVAYVGTSDPDGWLICNGRALSGLTHSKYANLKTLLSPDTLLPDLRQKNVYGSSTIKTTGGTNAPNITYNQLPVHNHGNATTNIAGNHFHNFADDYYQDSRTGGVQSNNGDDGGGAQNIARGTGEGNIVYNENHNVSTVVYGKSVGDAVYVGNPYYSVNWIIKY